MTLKILIRDSILFVFALSTAMVMTGCLQFASPPCPNPKVEPSIELIVEPAPEPIQGLASQERWRADLQYMAKQMPKIHKNIDFCTSKEDFERAVSRLDSAIPYLTDNQIIVELMKIVAIISVQGRDGHTRLFPLQKATGFHVYPLSLYLFSDGLFIADAQEEYQESIGARVLRIGDIDADELYQVLEPLVPRDNAMTVKSDIIIYFLIPEVLHALGIIEDLEQVDFLLQDSKGGSFTMNITPVQMKDYVNWVKSIPPEGSEPLYLSNVHENFWFKFLEGSNTLYIQYNGVWYWTQSGETMREFSQRISEFVDENAVDRVVVDLRHNNGGDPSTYWPLLHVLSQNEAINQDGKLFTVIGRDTFSAAGNFTTEMERKTNTIFVGEPTGSSPNQFGDPKPLRLLYSYLVADVSSWYWQKSDVDDDRLWHEPDIYIELSSKDFFSHRDPVMEAILDYKG